MCGFSESILVYVVDDDYAVRDSLAALLEPEGFAVRLFATAEDFLEGLEERHPGEGGAACVLLDLHMPGKGGHELLETMVARGNPVPVVVMTGNAHEKSRNRALRTGAVAFLEKPFDADTLIEVITASQRKFG